MKGTHRHEVGQEALPGLWIRPHQALVDDRHLRLGSERMTGRCLVCGQTVELAMMPLHAEDHAQAGEFPEASA